VTDIQEPLQTNSSTLQYIRLVTLTIVIVALWATLIMTLDNLRGDAACVWGCPDPPDLSSLLLDG